MLSDEQIARVCHEAHRAYCNALGDTAVCAAWDDAPEVRFGPIAGVAQIRANPKTTARESHESWLRQKEAEGWTYGPVKNPATKQHPCCVPYDELSPERKRMDGLFVAVARALLFNL